MDIRIGLKGKQNIMGFGILPVNVVGIVGSNHFDVVLTRPADEYLVAYFLIAQPVALQLDIVIIAKDIQIPFKYFFLPLPRRDAKWSD